jgi:iron complex transport system ATP-binding protein
MSTQTQTLLQLRGLSVAVDGMPLLQNLDLSVAPGELVGVIGPNGAGKSTLLRCLAGVEAATAGELLFAAVPLRALSLEQRARAIAWLEQRPQLHWPLSVEQVVALGRLPWRDQPQIQAAATAVEAALERCALLQLRQREFHSLSEGEKLLVNLARILAVESRLILADEPTSALDPRQQLRVMELLQSEARSGKAVLAVLHDLTLAARYCSRLLLLHQGKLIAAGTPEAVLTPQHLAAVYGIDARYDPGLRTVIINTEIKGSGQLDPFTGSH